MLKKRYFSFLFAYCVLAILQGQSCLCSQQDENRDQNWYKVTAPSGLVLRKDPDRSTAKLGAVPFDEEVLSCDNTGIRETIEEKTGEWLNELDLILAKFGGVGVIFKLYLSSTKLPGFILRYMAECFDSSC